MFETASVPPDWLNRAGKVDEIWVPSHFNAAALAAGGVPAAKVRVLPEAIEDRWLETRSPPYPRTGTFRFLSVFKWQYRKGWDVLLEAYCQEFTADDDVELLIRADPLVPEDCNIPTTVAAIQSKFRNPPRVRLLEEALQPPALRRLYAEAHAFVLPTRGEAWGRPFMEAMACGLLAIGTGWGGQLDFMDSSNSLLIDFDLADVPETAVREWPEFRGQQWAEPSVESLRHCLRRAVNNGADLATLRHNAREVIRQRYRQEVVGKLLANELRRHLP
ncbi:glycosyltransferase family 4 protein [Crystallibacter crystallopoietes]|uniref:glycosyltransferase family 4 protein n=1 Tax=Crystallibacter crystallopoietes TaxID=37928 RepID=UPI0002A4FD61|nr:glycosyltransferase family 4 protein [Arthrobacter crystallopoietes]